MKKLPKPLMLIILFVIIESPLAEKSLQSILLLHRKSTETQELTLHIAPNPPQNKANSSSLVLISSKQVVTNFTRPNNLTYMNPARNNTNSSPLVLSSTKQILNNLSITSNYLTYMNWPQNNTDSSPLVLTSTEQFFTNLTISKKLTYMNPPRNKTNLSPLVIISIEQLLPNLTIPNNLTYSQHELLRTWEILIPSLNISNSLPLTVKAMQEAGFSWSTLKDHIQHQIQGPLNRLGTKENVHCPYSISEKKSSRLRFHSGNLFYLNLPCGMVSGSSLTVIGTPGRIYGSFRIELIGHTLPGELEPPVVLHYTVRSLGNKERGDPMIAQNTWSPTDEWGIEERCPSDKEITYKDKVDGLEMCKIDANRQEKEILSDKEKNGYNITVKSLYMKKYDKKPKRTFPFKQGFLAISTIRIGDEGIHMVVDGKHITSFSYRSNLEPWLISKVRISGDIKLSSVIITGLPTSEVGSITDLAMLKTLQIAPQKSVDLFIGIFSTANNFRRRMAVRRTWMQYEDVRSGRVVVRFFVGLHKNEVVNEELWREAETYGDIQILPFVDYYELITWKSIAICIYGANVVSARYVMKTDDDAFVRVDSILSSLKKINITGGLLYGHLNNDTTPYRSVDSKWYVTTEEWEEEKYPTWANGPGYVVSHDVAKRVHEQFKRGSLKMFKLEDVAMGIWLNNMKKEGVEIQYANEDNIIVLGCEENYVIAHYQKPRDMHCLWKKLLETQRPLCCK